jgi:hypothetical protein
MRTVPVALAALLCLAMPAQAERRTFIVANDADGYGIDRCLAAGAQCGAAAANAYCKTQAFVGAAWYRKVDHDDITGANASVGSGDCLTAKCEAVAIVCSR